MTVDKTKHLGMILDKRLSFEDHVTCALELLYKLYVRPHLDYWDVVYQIPDNESKSFDSKNDNIHPLMTLTLGLPGHFHLQK